MLNISSFKSPVLLITYKRLDTTIRVLDAIRHAKPNKLYLSSNIGRSEKENILVNNVRQYIETNVDWPCELVTLYRTEHLSAKDSISGAIDWFFEHEKMGIILEDDCVPSVSFFSFCEQLLVRYQNDMRVWHIGGTCVLNDDVFDNDESYYFSHFNHIWGWASWANRWNKYDANIPLLAKFKSEKRIENLHNDYLLNKFWINNFEAVAESKVDTWDYQWYFTTWINGGISIVPTSNLISNVGFGDGATHTSDPNNKLANLPAKNIPLNLVHPNIIMPNVKYERLNARFLFNLTYISFCKAFIKKIINKFLKG